MAWDIERGCAGGGGCVGGGDGVVVGIDGVGDGRCGAGCDGGGGSGGGGGGGRGDVFVVDGGGDGGGGVGASLVSGMRRPSTASLFIASQVWFCFYSLRVTTVVLFS